MIQGPLPRTAKRGVPPTARKARTGLSTPPTRLRCARRYKRSECGARGTFHGIKSMSRPQRIEHLLRRRPDASEDRRLPLREPARLGRAELHHEVEEIHWLVGFEREQELLVVESKGVRGVDRDRRKFVAHPEVVPHDPLPTIERDRVPLALLDQGIHEEVATSARYEHLSGSVLTLMCVAGEVRRALRRRQIRMRRREIVTHLRRRNSLGHLLERLEPRGDRPGH